MDDIDKIHELLKNHGAILERTKKHKVWRFPDGRIWVVAGSPSCSRAYRNNYHALCDFLGDRPIRRKNPDRKAKKGVERPSGFRAAGVVVEDFGTKLLDSCTSWPHNILVLAGLFAIFLLLSACAYATRNTGRVRWLRPFAALTTNHLPLKGDSWLLNSVIALQQEIKPTGAFWRSRKPKAKPLNASNWTLPQSISSLTSVSRTRPLSPSTLSRMSWSTLNLRIGEPENTNRSNAGDLFTADRLASSDNSRNIKPEPAERRVLSSVYFSGWTNLSKKYILGLNPTLMRILPVGISPGFPKPWNTDSQPLCFKKSARATLALYEGISHDGGPFGGGSSVSIRTPSALILLSSGLMTRFSIFHPACVSTTAICLAALCASASLSASKSTTVPANGLRLSILVLPGPNTNILGYRVFSSSRRISFSFSKSFWADRSFASVARFCSRSFAVLRFESIPISSANCFALKILSSASASTSAIWTSASAFTLAIRSSLCANSSFSCSSLARITALFATSNASASVFALHCAMNVRATNIAVAHTKYMYMLFHVWKDLDKRSASATKDWIGCILRILVIALYGVIIPCICVRTILKNRRRFKGQKGVLCKKEE